MHTSESLYVCAHMIDCQLNPINSHWTNKSALELHDATNSTYFQLIAVELWLMVQSSALGPLDFYVGASFNLFFFFCIGSIRSWLYTIQVDS